VGEFANSIEQLSNVDGLAKSRLAFIRAGASLRRCLPFAIIRQPIFSISGTSSATNGAICFVNAMNSQRIRFSDIWPIDRHHATTARRCLRSSASGLTVSNVATTCSDLARNDAGFRKRSDLCGRCVSSFCEACAGAVWGADWLRFTQDFSQPASRKLASVVTAYKIKKLRWMYFSERRGRESGRRFRPSPQTHSFHRLTTQHEPAFDPRIKGNRINPATEIG
jgi:hypothetical protein